MSLPYITADWIMNAKDGEQCSIIDPATNKSVDVVLSIIWSKENVYFTRLDSDINAMMNRNEDDERSYSDFVKHVRNGRCATFNRKEWIDIISSGNYHIG